jgi:hypothetical protein
MREGIIVCLSGGPKKKESKEAPFFNYAKTVI